MLWLLELQTRRGRKAQVHTVKTAEIQTVNVAYCLRRTELSGFSAYPDGCPSQLIRIIAVLLCFLLWGSGCVTLTSGGAKTSLRLYHYSHLLWGQSVWPWQPVCTTDTTPLLSSRNRYLIFPSTSLPNPEGSDPLFMYSPPNCTPSNSTPLYHNLIIRLSLYPSDLVISTIFQFSYPSERTKICICVIQHKNTMFPYCKHKIHDSKKKKCSAVKTAYETFTAKVSFI